MRRIKRALRLSYQSVHGEVGERYAGRGIKAGENAGNMRPEVADALAARRQSLLLHIENPPASALIQTIPPRSQVPAGPNLPAARDGSGGFRQGDHDPERSLPEAYELVHEPLPTACSLGRCTFKAILTPFKRHFDADNASSHCFRACRRLRESFCGHYGVLGPAERDVCAIHPPSSGGQEPDQRR